MGYTISVGEPWDFLGPDGKNLVRGEITQIFEENVILFKSSNKIEFSSKQFEFFLLYPRQKLPTGSLNKLIPDLLPISCLAISDWPSSYSALQEITKNSKIVMIGVLLKT